MLEESAAPPAGSVLEVETVVVGFDGSDCAQRALAAAREVVSDAGTVHVVTAYNAPSNREILQAYASVPMEFTARIDLVDLQRRQLAEAVEYLARSGATVKDHLVDDDPASAILKVAEDFDADMIVVGSRGMGRISQVLRGSVSTKIAHHSPVNFMVIH